MVPINKYPSPPSESFDGSSIDSQSPRTGDLTSEAKRTRASKPKVRTGCVTCKIRRVKCDEQKPACVRCTSTGRVCDGYAGAPLPRKKHIIRHENQQPDAQAGSGLVSRTRVLRPLIADIEGTTQERMFFHRFRRVAETGLAIHVSNLGSFWKRLVPQMGHSDPAIKHALIALGSSWQTMKLQSCPNGQVLDPKYMLIDNYSAPKLELVTFQQYNKAIYHLQKHVASPWSPRSVEITLICCLIFICLETAQGNQDAVVAHISNGLQIIKTLPQELIYFSQVEGDEATKYDSTTHTHGYSSSRISRSEWRQLLDIFTNLEFGSLTYGLSQALADPQPSLSLRLRSCNSPFDDALPLGNEITSLTEANRLQIHLMLQIYTRIIETAPYKGDVVWWSNPVQKRLHAHMLAQVRRVLRLLHEFMTGPYGPSWENKAESCSILVDLVHTHGVVIAAECIPHNYTRREVGERFAGTVLNMVQLSEQVVKLFEHPDNVPDVMLDTGLMISLHVALSIALDPGVRRRGIEVLRFFGDKNETVYRGNTLVRLFEKYWDVWQDDDESNPFLDDLIGPALAGSEGLRGLEASLEAMTLDRRKDEGRESVEGN
ncbi:hypothetical protein F4810DRAFT_479813 [Camillea tinctor]|nr:hypothetical protein F4810DRAFT_479813 [Camillea tinctor]